jgi:hypothetical protein
MIPKSGTRFSDKIMLKRKLAIIRISAMPGPGMTAPDVRASLQT